jgi:aspartyl-tRNA(Asn)/glutamyl-tRNA(Gln) amidotransferase subunit C
VARLAHVGLSEAEIATLADQLSTVLEHVAILQEIDTDGVPPTAHVLPMENVDRPDEVKPSWPPPAVLANAPHQHDGFFEVQAIFD